MESNVNQNRMHLREAMPTCAGLVNGYFYGVVTSERAHQMTSVSDNAGGAAEDIERTLRYHSIMGGVCRLNFACAVARTYTNVGGLRMHYRSREARRAAQDFVIRTLALEFPQLIQFDECSANRCVFLQSRGRVAEHTCHLCDKTFTRKGALAHHKKWCHPDPAAPLPIPIECSNCKKTFRSKKAMLVHVRASRCHSTRGRKYEHGVSERRANVDH